MLPHILLITVCHCILLLGAERPNYRFDYRYEKAFDSFYKLHASATSWQNARIRCQAEGSQLLVPQSLDEADATPLLVTAILNKFTGIFVGIHDLYSERTFVTLKGNPLKDSILNLLWEYKEPMYRHGRCVAMRRSGRLFVHPCDQPLPFICKIKGENIKYFAECHTFNDKWKLGPNNTCYFMQKEPQTWHQAYATCLSAGGHLAILNNQTEVDHLILLYKEHHRTRMPMDDFAFLGYTDLFQLHHYRTVLGERLDDVGYKEWEITCPTGFNQSDKRRCGGMRRSGLLAINECDFPAMFFCEKPANVSNVKIALRQYREDPIKREEKALKKRKRRPKHATAKHENILEPTDFPY